MTASTACVRVLVVDDVPELGRAIRRLLSTGGYSVDVAVSAAEARGMSPAGYDLLVIDAQLGDERGADLIRDMQADDAGIARRCLMITGGDTGSLPAGIAHLAKPFESGELLDAVRALCPAPASVPHQDRAGPPAAETAGAAGAAPAARPGAGGGPARDESAEVAMAAAASAGALLEALRRLRWRERLDYADRLHDGPVQDLAAAGLGLRLLSGELTASQRAEVETVADQLDAAGRELRQLMARAAPPALGAPLAADTIRDRTAWLLATPAVVDVGPDLAELGPGPRAVLADVAELAIFLLLAKGPPAQARVRVRAEAQSIQVEVTLAGPGAAGGAATAAQLAGVAAALGGTARSASNPDGRRAEITLPAAALATLL